MVSSKQVIILDKFIMEAKMNIIDKVEAVLEDIKNGKMVIVTDDEDRENEGDLICAAEVTTYESINFMTKYARGLICVPITEERARKLNLHNMSYENTDSHSTALQFQLIQ